MDKKELFIELSKFNGLPPYHTAYVYYGYDEAYFTNKYGKTMAELRELVAFDHHWGNWIYEKENNKKEFDPHQTKLHKGTVLAQKEYDGAMQPHIKAFYTAIAPISKAYKELRKNNVAAADEMYDALVPAIHEKFAEDTKPLVAKLAAAKKSLREQYVADTFVAPTKPKAPPAQILVTSSYDGNYVPLPWTTPGHSILPSSGAQEALNWYVEQPIAVDTEWGDGFNEMQVEVTVYETLLAPPLPRTHNARHNPKPPQQYVCTKCGVRGDFNRMYNMNWPCSKAKPVPKTVMRGWSEVIEDVPNVRSWRSYG